MKVSKKSLFIALAIIVNMGLLALFVSPELSFAKKNTIYVDSKSSWDGDGSASKPYKTISKAIDKASKGDKIFVAKGKYTENIVIKDNIRIYGSDREDVIIEADNRKKTVVTMGDHTEINKVTIRKGRIGIEVKKDDQDVSIVDCIVEDNSRDGIRLEKGTTSKKEPVSITESILRDNGWNGLYSQKRRVVLMDNQIEDNDKDGVELESGTSSWIEGNKIKDNRGVGVKLYLDKSNIWTKKNTIRDNKKNGIEVKAFGGSGRIDIAKSKIFENKAYGIARVQLVGMNSSLWGGLTFDNQNDFYSNLSGNVSHLIRIY